MFQRLKWVWLDQSTWPQIPSHVLKETSDVLRTMLPSTITVHTRIHVAKQVHDAHLNSLQKEENHKQYIQTLWYRDYYPYIRQMERAIANDRCFAEFASHPDTYRVINSLIPRGCTLKRILPLYSMRYLQVEVQGLDKFHAAQKQMQIPRHIARFTRFVEWSGTYKFFS